MPAIGHEVNTLRRLVGTFLGMFVGRRDRYSGLAVGA